MIQPPNMKFLGITAESTWDGRGVYVINVTPYSAAFRIGIEPGDVIYSIDGVSVSSPQQLAHAIRYSDGFVEIYLRDVRTGQTIMRNADLTQ
jgi:S1-C subfamily serine protease